MKRLLIILFTLILFTSIAKPQILDVPYRYESAGICTVRCWAITAYMTLVYYGKNLTLCEIMESVRQDAPSLYPNASDCCLTPDLCCSEGHIATGANSIKSILDNYSVNNNYVSGILTRSEVHTELENNRPFITGQWDVDWGSGHVYLIFGFDSTDDVLYAHNTGSGSVILDYTEFSTYGLDGISWRRTLTMASGATTCPLVQDVIGILKMSLDNPYIPFIYKAQQSINISCKIENTADATFYSGINIFLEGGFRSALGSSFYLETGATLSCP